MGVVFHQLGAPSKAIFSSVESCLTRSGTDASRKALEREKDLYMVGVEEKESRKRNREQEGRGLPALLYTMAFSGEEERPAEKPRWEYAAAPAADEGTLPHRCPRPMANTRTRDVTMAYKISQTKAALS